MRIAFTVFWLALIFGTICYLFWQSELKYSLPTPIPTNYHNVSIGEAVKLNGNIKTGDKPVFIHFFNPDCPCSKFNIPHFLSLVKNHSADFNFYVVLVNAKKYHSPDEIKEKYNLPVPVIADSTLAATCGVYSTPQAVIIDKQSRLYYRGNYNQSRYCSNPNTEYARMAIDSFLNQHNRPAFAAFATTAYGCQVNYCSK